MIYGVSRYSEKEAADVAAISQLVYLERLWRDTAQWEKMHTTFHRDSIVRLTWFQGSGAEFVEASKAYKRTGRVSKHRLAPSVVSVNGDRGIVETTAMIEIRSKVGDIEVDIATSGRLYSRVIKEDGIWRLLTLDVIYEKDMISSVYPSDQLQIDKEELKKYRPSYQYLSYSQRLVGRTTDPNLPGDDRPDTVNTLYKEAEEWLLNKK